MCTKNSKLQHSFNNTLMVHVGIHYWYSIRVQECLGVLTFEIVEIWKMKPIRNLFDLTLHTSIKHCMAFNWKLSKCKRVGKEFPFSIHSRYACSFTEHTYMQRQGIVKLCEDFFLFRLFFFVLYHPYGNPCLGQKFHPGCPQYILI